MRGTADHVGHVGEEFEFLGTRMKLLTAGVTTGDALGVIEQEAPGGFRAPAHVHHGEDEAFFVVSGTATFHVGDDSTLARAGDFIWLPRNVPHWFEVEPGGPAKLLQLNLPARLEHFFVELGSPVDRSPVTPDFAHVAETAARYSVDLLPPTGD